MEPTLFGIGKAEWELYNSFSNWISAIATFAAVYVSLYLAWRAGKPKANLSVGHRIIVTPGDKRKPPEVIVFRIVNTGDRIIRVTNIGWRIGLWEKRYALQLFEASQSSALPIELAHGQEAQWSVPLDARDQPWLEYFANGMLKPHFWLSLRTVEAQFHTSIGTVFSVRPEKDLLARLRVAGMQQKAKE